MSADRGTADGEVKERILVSAIELFAEHGYAGASTAQIVASAAITKPMLYYYFGDKQSLFRAAVNRMTTRYREALAVVMARDVDVREQLVQIAQTVFHLAVQHPHEARLQFSAYWGPDRTVDPGEVEMGGLVLFEACFAAVERGVAQGVLRGDPSRVAVSVMGVMMMHVMGHLARPEAVALDDDMARTLVELYIDGAGA